VQSNYFIPISIAPMVHSLRGSDAITARGESPTAEKNRASPAESGLSPKTLQAKLHHEACLETGLMSCDDTLLAKVGHASHN
jgi:hypothetical protein